MKALSFLTVVGLLYGSTGLSLESGDAKKKAELPDKVPFTHTAPTGGDQGSASTSGLASGIGKGEDYNFRISGQIAAARKADLSFKVTGYVKAIQKKAGDVVKAGEVLALLDDTDYQLALKLAEAKKHQAEIHAKSARAEYERETQLKKENASTPAMFEKIEAGFQEARLGVQLADLNLQAARRNLSHTKLIAPYDCTVAEQVKDDGEYVATGTKVFTIYEVDATEVDLNVPERMVGKLSVGSDLEISVPSVQYKGKAKVTRVVPIVSDRTRTFRVTAKITGQDKRVVPGLFAEALLN